MSYKILNTIGEKFAEKGKKILEGLGIVDYLELSQSQLEEKIADYDILIIGLGLVVDRGVIEKAKNLKIIACPATGLDHIDLVYCGENKIKVLSLKGETEFLNSITGTAELAFGLMISLLRKIPFAFDDVKKNYWRRDDYFGNNLKDKTLGIVGLGRLGKLMAQYAKAFDMRVLAFDPYKESDFIEAGVGRKATLAELVSQSDIVSLHVPLNQETENMFDEKIIGAMKLGSFLINTSRGKVVDEMALIEALVNKKVAGYATDVLADELDFINGKAESSLIEYTKENNNVIITPHIGGATFESREATDIFIAEKIRKLVSN